ncbi:Nose resistant to fluoxetine protein 6 [Pseudolycoriella hygida]|uniref:Nose resistant to fluoxetine protein 6 n=1 Tax=Pseudolycoriella hygida TaxID=35572 RepID=A0A9Q0RUW0_9DIPT|nr:Nose resistant to fluoxetine protein 6 [Pseudolycoriella hygida]
MWFFKFLVFVACGFSVFSDEVVRNVMEESEIVGSLSENIVVYGIIAELASGMINVTATCSNELVDILRGINKRDMWAIKVMDASGTYHGSAVWGSNAWLGSRRSCDYLNNPPKFPSSPDIPKTMDKNLISTISKMEMKFKMVFLHPESPLRVDYLFHIKSANTFRLGLCLPSSCSIADIELLSKSFFSKSQLNFQKLFNATLDVIEVRNVDFENFLNRPEVSAIFLGISAIVTLVIFFSFANSLLKNTNRDGLKRFLKCFSIYDNVASIFSTTSSPTAINSINGLRTVICCWVLLIHVGFFTMFAYDNLPEVFATIEQIQFQPILAIMFYVDIFFVLSAFLVVYNFLKDEGTLSEIRSNCFVANLKMFFKRVIHRYIRLTPAFLFAIGVGHILAIYTKEASTYYIDGSFDSYATPTTFWYSVFYIHNIFKVPDLCLSWSWYLACDMQFYIVILFILFVHARYPATAKSIFLALIAALTAGGIYLNVDMNLLPRFDSVLYHLDEFYIEPWNRMHPYLAGCAVGYVMFKIKDKKFPKNRFITVSYCTGAIVTFVATLFSTSFTGATSLIFALALSFGRFFMGLFIGSIVVMCHIGYGGMMNTFVSHRLFVHVNKVTYVMYLVHPLIIIFFNANLDASPHYDTYSIAPTICGILLISYIAAIVLSPLIEIPFQKLSDEYVMKKSKTKK